MYVKTLNIGLWALSLLVAAPISSARDNVIPSAMYTMSNATDGNSVLLFKRNPRTGRLKLNQDPLSFPTGGNGTGGSLGNQSAVVLDESDRWLYVVNAGSGSISVFKIERDGLSLIQTIPSGGTSPISLAIHDHLLYVLNENPDKPDSITGFTIGDDGALIPLPGSTRELSGVGTDPAQIAFNPDGKVLVVTEKATDIVDTFIIDENGLPSNRTEHPSARPTPFGFAFGKRNQVFISEANRSTPNVSYVVSYELANDGSLQLIEVENTTETAACWVVVTHDGRFAFASNTGSASISGLKIDFDGELQLLKSDGVSGRTGAGPLDIALSQDNRHLYSLDSGVETITAFRVLPTGRLIKIQTVSDLPDGANGLAVR
jgi:6-phosphogluconolactonase